MKTIKIIIGALVAISVFTAFALAAMVGDANEKAYIREFNTHVVETWENAPENFHGHDCKYGDWCTKSYYDHLKSERSK